MNAMIFVFGSNEQGIHGRGAARHALKHHGAIWGIGNGRRGNSFGIPTRECPNGWFRTLPLEKVGEYIHNFLTYARIHSKERFQITRIGCGLAGFKDKEIAPLFTDAPSNCYFDVQWFPYLGSEKKYWGTH